MRCCPQQHWDRRVDGQQRIAGASGLEQSGIPRATFEPAKGVAKFGNRHPEEDPPTDLDAAVSGQGIEMGKSLQREAPSRH